MRNFATTAIRWWIKRKYPEEYEKHETFNDWHTCFLNRYLVLRWGKNMRKYGDHKKRRSTKWDKMTPEVNPDDELVIKEEVISPAELSEPINEPNIEKIQPEKTVLCEQCDYRAKSQCILKYHVEAKHTEPTIPCGECSKRGVVR